MKNLVSAIAIVSLPVIIFGYLLWVDLAPSGVREAQLVVGGSSPFIDRILPDQRVENGLKTESGDTYTRVIDQPAYFAVHPPATHFNQIEVELEFRNNGVENFRLALINDYEHQSYTFRDVEIDAPKNGDEWTRGRATFDLAGVPTESGAYKFVLSLPYVKENNAEFLVHSTTIRFKKPPLTWRNLISELIERIPGV